MIHKLIGYIVSRPAVADYLYWIALGDPDQHIMSPDGKRLYMWRGWLFNKITDHKRKYPWIKFSIRVHYIVMPDLDRHRHDHPFEARTYIMKGGYTEEREHPVESFDDISCAEQHEMREGGRAEITDYESRRHYDEPDVVITTRRRVAGDTATFGFGRYHRITEVPQGGAITLFAFGDYKGMWGFNVNGTKIPYRDYAVMMGKGK